MHQRCDLAGAQCGDLRQAARSTERAMFSRLQATSPYGIPGHQGYVREIQKNSGARTS